MRFTWLVLIAAFVVIADSSIALACIVRFRPPDELKKEAGLVIIATILSRQANKPSAVGELYSYDIRVHSVERGSDSERVKKATYYNVRATVRGDEITCPLKDGSGLELNLEEGASYRLYLKNANESEILFSELVK